MRLLPTGLLMLLAGSLLAGCGSGTLERQDEAVRQAWAETLHQYERRESLVPALLSRVQSLVDRNDTALAAVTEAHARVSAMDLSPATLGDLQAFERGQALQGELDQALLNLLTAADGQAELATDENYRDLRAQLRGLESRIAMARKRYAEAVQAYNDSVDSFPTSITAGMLDYEEKPAIAIRTEARELKAASPGHEAAKPLASQ
jgi:LemA protein